MKVRKQDIMLSSVTFCLSRYWIVRAVGLLTDEILFSSDSLAGTDKDRLFAVLINRIVADVT